MKPTRTGRTWARFDDGTCWPIPCPDDDADSVAHVVRYGTLTRVESVRYDAASTIEAYRHLIDLPQRKRNARVKAIREAMAMRDNEPREGSEDNG